MEPDDDDGNKLSILDVASVSSENSLSLPISDVESFDSDSESNQVQVYTNRYSDQLNELGEQWIKILESDSSEDESYLGKKRMREDESVDQTFHKRERPKLTEEPEMSQNMRFNLNMLNPDYLARQHKTIIHKANTHYEKALFAL